jgi:catechol 2,3-dioxygenase-like lactoylglutathione lyase family enzyme
MSGIPGLEGTEHIGLTVPDLDVATRFFVDVIGGRVLFEAGPFLATDDWMEQQLGVHPRAVIRRLRMVKVECGPSLELFEYEAPDQDHTRPRNSDWSGHHIAFYVNDMPAAVAHLRSHNVDVMGEPMTISTGPSADLTWVYFRAPWGLQLELVCSPNRMAYERAGGEWMWRPSKGS